MADSLIHKTSSSYKVVPEKSLTKKKLINRQNNIRTEKAKTNYPLYTSYNRGGGGGGGITRGFRGGGGGAKRPPEAKEILKKSKQNGGFSFFVQLHGEIITYQART